jgi:hypothetical protein
MRIIEEFNHHETKITVFTMNDRISIKFERDRLEIIHKFRDGAPINTAADARAYCDENLLKEIEKVFDSMNNVRMESLVRLARAEKESEWTEII